MISMSEEMSTPSSPAPSLSPSMTELTPNSLLSAMTFSSSMGVVKASAELKTVKRELFRAQHQQRLLKIDLEREKADRLQEREKFENQVRELEAKLVESNHDIEFINEAEEQAKLELKTFKSKTTNTERELRTEISSLKQKLATEQDARIEAENRAANLFSKHDRDNFVDPSEEFEELVQQWKERVHELEASESDLSSKVIELEQENEQLKNKQSAQQEYETLNRILLSTFTDLDTAKDELQRRRSEAERISARIGSVLELEEKLRSATVELNRMKSGSSRSSSPLPQLAAQNVPASRMETLKIASLMAEITNLREQVILAQAQTESLKAELEAKSSAYSTVSNAFKEAQRRTFELEVRLKKQ